MLTNLLPGLRDLRAPLAAGYLWLAGFWLLVVNAVPARSAATGVLAHIYTLASALGRGTVLVAISFVAYLIGSVLSVDADGAVVASLAPRVTRVLGERESINIVQVRGVNITGRLSIKVIDDIIDKAIQLKASAVLPIMPGKFHDNDDDTIKVVLAEWNAGVKYPIFPRRHGRLLHHEYERYGWVNSPWALLSSNMIENLLREIRQLVTKLRVSSPPLFDQYDRARGEAEFRISVAFPLIFLAGVLAWKWTPLWLLLLLGVILIMESGLRRAREATDVVAQAALAGYVTPSGWPGPNYNPLIMTQQVIDEFTRGARLGSNEEGREDEQKYAMIIQLLGKAVSTDQPTDTIPPYSE